MDPDDFDILQEDLTKALISGNFRLYQSLMHLPLHLHPTGGKGYTLDTTAALEEDFQLYHQALSIQRATDIYRKVLAFSTPEPGWSEVTVETNILGSTGRIVEPFQTQFTLRLFDCGWRITQIRSSLGHVRWSRGMADITAGRFDNIQDTDWRASAAPDLD